MMVKGALKVTKRIKEKKEVQENMLNVMICFFLSIVIGKMPSMVARLVITPTRSVRTLDVLVTSLSRKIG